jgi:hypothetical protein
MANIERRVAALEGSAPASPLLQLRNPELEWRLEKLCAASGTTLEKEIEEHGGRHAYLLALREWLLGSVGVPRHAEH